MDKEKKYLLDVTFYAGSDDPEDTDKGLYILSVKKDIEEAEMKEMFKTVNKLLDVYDEEDTAFPISYEEGINIDTLMSGIEFYLKGKVKKVKKPNITADNYFVIEQWQ
jgi:hypothetical protein